MLSTEPRAEAMRGTEAAGQESPKKQCNHATSRERMPAPVSICWSGDSPVDGPSISIRQLGL
jgi:hypothetical protein